MHLASDQLGALQRFNGGGEARGDFLQSHGGNARTGLLGQVGHMDKAHPGIGSGEAVQQGVQGVVADEGPGAVELGNCRR